MHTALPTEEGKRQRPTLLRARAQKDLLWETHCSVQSTSQIREMIPGGVGPKSVAQGFSFKVSLSNFIFNFFVSIRSDQGVVWLLPSTVMAPLPLDRLGVISHEPSTMRNSDLCVSVFRVFPLWLPSKFSLCLWFSKFKMMCLPVCFYFVLFRVDLGDILRTSWTAVWFFHYFNAQPLPLQDSVKSTVEPI